MPFDGEIPRPTEQAVEVILDSIPKEDVPPDAIAAVYDAVRQGSSISVVTAAPEDRKQTAGAKIPQRTLLEKGGNTRGF